MPFTFQKLEIPDIILITPQTFHDQRGFFLETYKLPDFSSVGIPTPFVQENHSRSHRGVIRGLHYQNPPMAQGKLVRVVSGSIFDVAVDIRIGSPTFGKWVGVILSEDNQNMLYIPEGFAHGFSVLTDSADVIYKVTNIHSPASEAGILYRDTDLAINWQVENPILSEKDMNWPKLKEAKIGFHYEQKECK